MLTLLKAIYSHLYAGQATDPHQAVGGITSANVHRTLSLDASGNLNVNVAAGGSTPAGTSTLSNVASSASSVTLLSSNSSRLGGMFFNDSTSRVLVKFGTTASATSFTTAIGPQGYFELPAATGLYSGRIDAIWDAANGNMRITELTA